MCGGFERPPCLMHNNAKKFKYKMKQTALISPCPVAARAPPAPARSWGWRSQERQLSPSQRFVMGRETKQEVRMITTKEALLP